MRLLDAFLPLLVAHLIGDFIFQTEQMALKKGNSWRYLIWHSTELGLITLACCWTWNAWPIAVVVFFTHVVFDWTKPRLPGNPLLWYLVDQVGHVIVLLFCAEWMKHHLGLDEMPLAPYVPLPIQAIIAAYITVGRPVTVAIGLFLKPWQDEILKANGNGSTHDPITGLNRSGEWVGNWERFIILTCILANQYSLIAALLVMKAIIRFGDVARPEQRKRADYILLGTLASIGLALAIGFLALQVEGAASALRSGVEKL